MLPLTYVSPKEIDERVTLTLCVHFHLWQIYTVKYLTYQGPLCFDFMFAEGQVVG